MKMIKSIAIGKIGRSISFNKDNWGAIGGDNEAPIFYENLFHKNPDITFYIVGSSDYRRLDSHIRNRINKHGNVIDHLEGFDKWRKTNSISEEIDHLNYMEEWMKTAPQIDIGLLVIGATGSNNVKGKTFLKTDHTTLASPLSMFCKYSGPVMHYLNATQLPYVMVINDPRYFPSTIHDIFNMPKFILSQYNEVIEYKNCCKWYNIQESFTAKINSEYSAMETIFLIGKERDNYTVQKNESSSISIDSFFTSETSSDCEEATNKERDIKFMIVCNEGNPSRYNTLKKYILDYIDDVDIYGKWEQGIINNDKRFKGPRKFNDLQEIFPRVKYTFCIPIKKGWVTSKFWEMAHSGIIPFLHPEYDEQNNLKCPDFIRIKDPKDLYKKIEFLEKNPEAYEILNKNLNAMIKDSYYDGTYINDLVITKLNDVFNQHKKENDIC